MASCSADSPATASRRRWLYAGQDEYAGRIGVASMSEPHCAGMLIEAVQHPSGAPGRWTRDPAPSSSITETEKLDACGDLNENALLLGAPIPSRYTVMRHPSRLSSEIIAWPGPRGGRARARAAARPEGNLREVQGAGKAQSAMLPGMFVTPGRNG